MFIQLGMSNLDFIVGRTFLLEAWYFEAALKKATLFHNTYTNVLTPYFNPIYNYSSRWFLRTKK